jgi:hypothetical protein
VLDERTDELVPVLLVARDHRQRDTRLGIADFTDTVSFRRCGS